MRVAYGKIGRSIPLTLNEASNVGGDVEVVRLLDTLLEAGHEVHLVGRNRGTTFHTPAVNGRGALINQWVEGGVFANHPAPDRHVGPVFTNYSAFFHAQAPKLPTFDAWFVWLGQHGSSLHPMPTVMKNKTGYTNPMVSDVIYGYPLVALVNELDVQPFWICPDPRNMIKFRDLWNTKQRTVLAQFNTAKDNTFFDERDGRLREGQTRYDYSGVELLATTLPDVSLSFGDAPVPERLFGALINEGYNNLGAKGRLHLIKRWFTGLEYELFGTWSDESQRALGRQITSVPLADVDKTLQRWRCTMTFPATGTGWATAKPWECFRAGCICFKHPDYDSQEHIYSKMHMNAELHAFLCPPTQAGFITRVEQLKDDVTWRHFADLQLTYLRASFERLRGGAIRPLQIINDSVTLNTQ